MVNDKGRMIDEYAWNNLKGIKKIGRLTNANMSFGMNFESKKGKEQENANAKNEEEKKKKLIQDTDTPYVEFNMPWSFRFDYSLYYNNSFIPNQKATINQSLSMGGQLSLTDKWKMDMNTNFDVQAMKFSFTTVNITRTLHCWSMSFNFVPFGDRKSYSFNLSASSSMLQDLKINKQSTWRDN